MSSSAVAERRTDTPSTWPTSRAHATLVQVLRLLPQDVRARAACVCRVWRDAAADPALFATLCFFGCTATLSDEALARLCARAGAALREVRLDAPSCKRVTADGAIQALRQGGCGGVQRVALRTSEGIPGMCTHISVSAAQAQQLAAAAAWARSEVRNEQLRTERAARHNDA